MTADREAQLAELSQWPHELQHVADLGAEYTGPETREPAGIDDANVYTSRIVGGAGQATGKHTVVLDLDVPARLVPSSTPGHSHLFVDVSIGWPHYRELLVLLARLGVIEDGYAGASVERGHTAVRLPWIKKEATAE